MHFSLLHCIQRHHGINVLQNNQHIICLPVWFSKKHRNFLCRSNGLWDKVNNRMCNTDAYRFCFYSLVQIKDKLATTFQVCAHTSDIHSGVLHKKYRQCCITVPVLFMRLPCNARSKIPFALIRAGLWSWNDTKRRRKQPGSSYGFWCLTRRRSIPAATSR